MKLRKLFLICLLISLWTRTTKAEEVDTVLHPGDKSPYYGVLVDPDHYKSFTIDEKEATDFRNNLENYVLCPDKGPTVSLFSSSGIEFVIGIGVLSFVAGVVISHW